MSGKLFIAGFVALIAVASAHAGPATVTPGTWTRETRLVGNRVTVDVFHRAPYALTGGTREPETRGTPGPWTRETRHVGRLTIDVYRR
jgi:hypothetical protein